MRHEVPGPGGKVDFLLGFQTASALPGELHRRCQGGGRDLFLQVPWHKLSTLNMVALGAVTTYTSTLAKLPSQTLLENS